MTVKPITKHLATKAFNVFKRRFKGYYDPTSPYGPLLRKNETGHWEIMWEEGPFEWAINFSDGGVDTEVYYLARDAGATYAEARALATNPRNEIPASIFSEPINSYTLGLYPA